MQRGPADRALLVPVNSDGIREVIAVPWASCSCDFVAKLSEADEMAVHTDDAKVSPEDTLAILGISRLLERKPT
jgi:hypothetical protein